MKILFVYKTCFPETFGGIEQVLLEQCRGLLARGHHVKILTLSKLVKKKEVVDYLGITIVRLPVDFEVSSSPFSLAAIGEFRRLQRRCDVVHLHYPWPFGDLLYLFSGSKKPVVVTYHSDIVKQKWLKYVYSPLMAWCFHRVRVIAATSPNYIETSRSLRPYRNKTISIPLGLDEHSYPAPRAAMILEYRNQWGGRYLCFVGVFRYYKGLDVLVEAATRIRATVVLVGDGPLRPGVEALAIQRRVSNIVFVGAVDHQTKVDILAGSCGFVFPSAYRSEAFGLSLVESAMLGKPMVSCEIGTGTSYVNVDGQTGFVVPPFDPVALAEAANRLVADVALSERMGLAGRQRFERLFTACHMATAYGDLYHQIVAKERL